MIKINSSNIIVKGNTIDNETRCVHYHSEADVVAIKFKCCNTYYPCYFCHQEDVQHEAKVWKKKEFNTKAILCGRCKTEMTIKEYLQSNNQCHFCNGKFNPSCKNHYPLYFETEA